MEISNKSYFRLFIGCWIRIWIKQGHVDADPNNACKRKRENSVWGGGRGGGVINDSKGFKLPYRTYGRIFACTGSTYSNSKDYLTALILTNKFVKYFVNFGG
jgi:hypothetical protein